MGKEAGRSSEGKKRTPHQTARDEMDAKPRKHRSLPAFQKMDVASEKTRGGNKTGRKPC